jgi:Pyridine nucleotide-disulphide oxidoreductase
MTQTEQNVSNHQRVRIANFSGVDLATDPRLDLAATDHEAALSQIRAHADLPYVYVVDDQEAGQIPRLLSALRATRSPCYPYALFTVGGAAPDVQDPELEVIPVERADPETILQQVSDYASRRLHFDHNRMTVGSTAEPPAQTGVVIIGAGITGLYAASQLQQAGIPFCVLEKKATFGGIWSDFANTTSQVNTSECAYRLFDKPSRSNRDHSFTREVLEDLTQLSGEVTDQLFLETEVEKIQKSTDGYQVAYRRHGETRRVDGKGVILAINDRVGEPRKITYGDQEVFTGDLVSGISDAAAGVQWRGKNVVIVGMGAFAVENARTALEAGARHVTVVGRRLGTICPKIIDYLNFTTPYDAQYQHPNKSNVLNMMYWKKLYQLSGAREPECWMGELKHDGHTISVSDIWFIAHHLKKLETVTGQITRLTERGVLVNDDQAIEADVVVNCVGFERSSSVAAAISGTTQTYNNNYVDRNFMYLADAHIDANAFNSLFGSSVLEMVKFYVRLFIRYYESPDYDEMMQTEGIEQIRIDDRKWSDYIRGAMALIRQYPDIRATADELVAHRSENFQKFHDLETYIADNKREWTQTHALLAGKPVAEADCLPYVFERLLKSKRVPASALR